MCALQQGIYDKRPLIAGKGLKLVPYQKAVKEMLIQYEKAEAAKKVGKAKPVSSVAAD